MKVKYCKMVICIVRKNLQKNVKFKVIVTFEDTKIKASDHNIELSSINDVSGEFPIRSLAEFSELR